MLACLVSSLGIKACEMYYLNNRMNKLTPYVPHISTPPPPGGVAAPQSQLGP